MPARIQTCVIETNTSPNSSISERTGILRWLVPATTPVMSLMAMSAPVVISTVPMVSSCLLRDASGRSSVA